MDVSENRTKANVSVTVKLPIDVDPENASCHALMITLYLSYSKEIKDF